MPWNPPNSRYLAICGSVALIILHSELTAYIVGMIVRSCLLVVTTMLYINRVSKPNHPILLAKLNPICMGILTKKGVEWEQKSWIWWDWHLFFYFLVIKICFQVYQIFFIWFVAYALGFETALLYPRREHLISKRWYLMIQGVLKSTASQTMDTSRTFVWFLCWLLCCLFCWSRGRSISCPALILPHGRI